MARLATICARGGSKGVPGKNLRELHGKPLIAHTIEQAISSNLFENVAVSSDDTDILETARAWGADISVLRPSALASDTAPKIPAIQHCVREAENICSLEFDVIVDLDTTSPLRQPSDIVGAVALLEDLEIGNVITGAPARRSPYFNLVERNNEGIVSLSKVPSNDVVRRQDAPACFDMNASIYVWRRDVLLGSSNLFNDDTRLFEMPEERSWDIDSELDFNIVEMLMERR